MRFRCRGCFDRRDPSRVAPPHPVPPLLLTLYQLRFSKLHISPSHRFPADTELLTERVGRGQRRPGFKLTALDELPYLPHHLRLEWIVDFFPGEIVIVDPELVYLVSLPFDGGGVQGHDKFRIMKFLVERRERDAFHLPEVLSRSVAHPFDSIVQTRRFDIAGIHEMAEHAGHDMRGSGMHTIDHKTFDLDRIDEQVRVGSTEIWEFDNSGGDEIHPMHIHGAAFRVFDRIGGRSALTATERGVKDTVLVMPGEKVRLLVTFSAHPGKFVFHCHNLEHEEDGMMLNYTSS
jgi:FtsP/CotA-like multicopper oxidase with cupredoxin domain